jgi:ankyrin repeat protein
MPLPPALESEFELVEGLPAGKLFDCYHVKDSRKGGADAVVRLLPENFAADQSIVNRFHEYFSRLNDIPNRRYIPSVYSVVGVAGKDVYVVEEYCPGVSLSQFVEKNRGSKTFISDVAEILARVCEALHHSHQKSIYHLCVLPADILIDDQDYSKVKLVGFGAQIFAEKGKIDYLSGESNRFVAPEVFKRGVFGPKADVYSLAVTIKDLLPEFSERSDLLGKALSITLKDRFSSARQFAANLKELAVTDPGAEPAPKVIQPVKPKGGLHPVVKIITEPAQAEIWCNGKILGVTASSGFMILWKPGNVIEIKKTGYSTETLDLTAPPDKADITVALTSSLTLYTNPWGASVKVNGVFVGATTYKGLTVPWDKGEIIIEKQGFKSGTFRFDTPPSEAETFIELEPQLATVPLRLNESAPLADEWYVSNRFSDRLTNVISKMKTVPEFRALAYVLSCLLVLSLAIVLASWFTRGSGIEKLQSDLTGQLQQKEAEISRLKQVEREKSSVQIELQKQLSDLHAQLKSKETDVANLSKANQSQDRSITEFQKQLNALRSQISDKDNQIYRMTQSDQEKLRSNAELQKKLSDMQSQLSDRDKEISRLKTAQISPPTITPTSQFNSSLNYELLGASNGGSDQQVKSLLARGADPNFRNPIGVTPLMYAAGNNKAEQVRTLLASGADPSLKDKDGWTAEEYARRRNHYNIVSLLNPSSGSKQPQNPPRTQFNSSLKDELFTACSGGDVQKVRNLLWSRVDPNARSQGWGRTPLIIAIDNNQVQVVKVLLISGADPTLMDRDGRDALHWAKWRNNPEIIELLQKHK